MKIILGSQSEGRRQILTEMGYKFEVRPANIDEKAIRFTDPQKLTLALANAKANALLAKITEPAILITSDQVVICDGKIREKPESVEMARNYLQSYNTQPAETVTAVVVTNTATGKRYDGIDIAKVYFNEFTTQDIEKLITEKKIFTKAGGFLIQEALQKGQINKVSGTIDSVVGLPKILTQNLISQASNE